MTLDSVFMQSPSVNPGQYAKYSFQLFLILLPFGFPIFTSIIPADFPMLFFILFSLPVICSLTASRCRVLDALYLFFLGFTFFGADIGRYPESFLLEVCFLSYCYLILRSTVAYIIAAGGYIKTLRLLAYGITLLISILAIVMAIRIAGYEDFIASFLSTANKLCWPFRTSNQLGIFLISGFPIACLLFIRRDKAIMALYCGVLLACGGVGSRIVFVAAMIQIFFIELAIFTIHPYRHWQIIRRLSLGFILTAVVISLGPMASFKRVIGEIPQAPLTFSEERLKNFEDFLSLGKDLIFGIGLGCFKKNFPHEVHNTFLGLMAESGIGGFLCMMCLSAVCVMPVIRSIRSSDPKLREVGFLLALSLGGLFLTGMFHNISRNRMLWTLLGFVFVLEHPNITEKADAETD